MFENDKYMENWTAPKKQGKETSWKEIQAKIGTKETKVIPLYRRMKWVSVAASLALLLGLALFLNNGQNESFVAANGEKEIVSLPDGSRIFMNAGSQISFDSKNWDQNRVVKLKGEAFFEVEKGKRFSVEAENGIVEVLGTSFNVLDRAGVFQVSCKTGKVKVSAGDEFQILVPGLKTSLEKGQLVQPYSCELTSIDQWCTNGLYHFDNVPLKSAFAELERQFNVKINLDLKDENSLVNADVPLEDLGLAMNILATAFNLDFTQTTDKNYTVTNK